MPLQTCEKHLKCHNNNNNKRMQNGKKWYLFSYECTLRSVVYIEIACECLSAYIDEREEAVAELLLILHEKWFISVLIHTLPLFLLLIWNISSVDVVMRVQVILYDCWDCAAFFALIDWCSTIYAAIEACSWMALVAIAEIRKTRKKK